MARAKKLNPRALPLDGVIRGGPLNGWSYLYLGFLASPQALVLRARCTPPKWPFPCDINLDEELLGDLVEAEPIKLTAKQRERAEALHLKQRYVPLETEIEAAYKVAQLDPPLARIWFQAHSLRDIVASINADITEETT